MGKGRKKGKGEPCSYCRRRLEAPTSRGQLAATRDHTVPSYKGGEHTVWCCTFCNGLKGPVDLHIWLRFIAEQPLYWRKENRHFCEEFRRKHHNIEWRLFEENHLDVSDSPQSA